MAVVILYAFPACVYACYLFLFPVHVRVIPRAYVSVDSVPMVTFVHVTVPDQISVQAQLCAHYWLHSECSIFVLMSLPANSRHMSGPGVEVNG